MALLANNDRERTIYVAQIPGIRRNCAWSEEQYRYDELPQEVLDVGLEEWQEFLKWRQNSDVDTSTPLAETPDASTKQEPRYQAWTLEPLVGRIPVIATTTQQSSDELAAVHAKLKPWYTKQLYELIQEQDFSFEWSISSLRIIHKSFFRRIENPAALHVVLKGEARSLPSVQQRMQTTSIEPNAEVVTYMDTVSIEEPAKTDEQLIQEQLALYGATMIERDEAVQG